MIQHRFGPGQVTDLGFLPDGRLVVGLERDPDLWLWDAARGEVGRFGFRRRARGTVTSLAVAPGRPWVAVQHSTTGLSVWDVAKSKRLLRAAGYTPQGALAFSADGALLAAVANGFWQARAEVRLWDLTRRRELPRVGGGGGVVRALAFAPDGKTLVTAGTDQRVRFWDVETGKERGGFASWVAEWLQRFVGVEPRPARGELRNRTQIVRDLAFSPDGRWLATTAGWGAMLWELPPGELSAAALAAAQGKSLSGHKRLVGVVRFSPDGRLLLTAGGDGRVKVWRVPGGAELATFDFAVGRVHGAAFAPDGLRAAAGGDDGRVAVWDVE